MMIRKVAFYVILLLCICLSQLVISQKASTQLTMPKIVQQNKYLAELWKAYNEKVKSLSIPISKPDPQLIFCTEQYRQAWRRYGVKEEDREADLHDAEMARLAVWRKAEMRGKEKKEKAEVWSSYRLREGCVPLTQVISKDPNKGRIIQNPYNVEESLWKPYKILKPNNIESDIEGIKYHLISIEYQLSKFEEAILGTYGGGFAYDIKTDVSKIKSKVSKIHINTIDGNDNF